MNHRYFYRRRLPHFQPHGATLFVTFRLAGSLPAEVLAQYYQETRRLALLAQQKRRSEATRHYLSQERKRLFGWWDRALDQSSQGPLWLQETSIARWMADSIHYRDAKIYDLIAFCIMPNHVHLLISPLVKQDGTYHVLPTIMHSLKRHTARQANQLLGRSGAFWQEESYDHVGRNDREQERIVPYILNNPVKAGLVAHWEDWEWSFSKW